MDHLHLLKACFLLIPAFLLGCLVFSSWCWPKRLPAAIVLAVVLAFGVAAWLPGIMDYLVSFSIMAIIYSILSLGLNAQWGYNGHLDFGVAGFFAVGAFTMALFVTSEPAGVMAAYAQQWFGLNAPYLVGVVAAGIMAGVVAYLIAQPILHLRADFLAIATLGIAEIIRLIFQNERWLANGPQPLSGITQPLSCLLDSANPCSWLPEAVKPALSAMAPRDYSYLYLVIVSLGLAVVYVLLETMVRSPWGRALRAVRDEEESAAMNGKPVKSLRVQSFVLGAVIIGVAGALYAPYMVTIDYSHFKPLFATFLVWVMLMLGGSGNNKGAILGAFVIWAVWSGTGFVTDYLQVALQSVAPDMAARMSFLRWAFVGLLLALIVLYRPQGILPEKKRVSRFIPDGPKK
ncbi:MULTISPECIES: branched-chain amino acid ABC transporter permease [unclassified Castellaniella]|uniref:branched-chain amino acid ABC transporter permease n=1 Tax=unclassified Castellaniella TaxID=2617606 RepID=UPI0033155E34